MLARRMLVFVAILMGLTALAAGLSTPPGARLGEPSPEPVLGAPTHPATPAIERTLDLGAPPQTVAVNQGDELRLTVEGDALDTVELVGMDQLAAIAPETPAVFDLLADRPGSYPIRLVGSGRHAGRLEVTPAAE
jgi:hypothetical protein